MCRWLIMLVLTVVSTTAWAQSVSPANVTAKAQEVVAGAERRVGQLAGQKAQLTARWESELSGIDRLKQQKKTWNRERELKEKLSAANETATALKNVEAQLTAATSQLIGARRVLVTAIDNELATKPPASRTEALGKLRAQLVPQVRKQTLHRIAIPNLDVDPSADPEDLDAQAAELRRIETELERQMTGLETQRKELARIDDLRKSHDRSIAFDRREDNSPTRNTPAEKGGRGAGTLAEDSANPQSPDTSGGDPAPPPTTMGDGPGYEAEAREVLADVIDPSTMNTLDSAQRSGDPGKRAKAAAKTRDAVKAKLDLLRQKRGLIEARAKQLRK